MTGKSHFVSFRGRSSRRRTDMNECLKSGGEEKYLNVREWVYQANCQEGAKEI
jgi:hypothetical protein